MNSVRLDIVSDVVCPWCIVGYRQLDAALQQTGVEAEIHWHPFELNPQMPDEGQNMLEHIAEKYGMTEQQSQENRQNLIDIGKSLDFNFDYSASSRMVNTFKAHQLLHWAGLQDKEHELKLALFKKYFTDQADINDTSILLELVESLDMDSVAASEVLQKNTYASVVREREAHWTGQGIQGVPAVVVNQKYLLSGAQGVENYVQMIEQVSQTEAAKP